MRFWTVEEARAYLPRVKELLGTVEQALKELEDEGVVLRQLANGLVDFPAVGDDGDVYFLCWKTDEPDIEWCHAPQAGFAGRRRLTDLPEPLDGP
ncbi:MAG: hypothetical protein QOK43_2934 [Acidimicrobiaceae bacterium]|jgi:hypothetical protein|nr:hypothetical protein [Acidimicrobiaceae bacterium]MDQ1443897.1 hypothetical protein [Acidimicrobiaceae bacterium]